MKILLLAIVASLALGGESFQIVSREEWGGEESKRTEVLENPVKLAIIQHTVTQECLTDDACAQTVRNLWRYFINIGFTDIAFNFLIGGNGKVYEGAGWHLVGAHTRAYNNKSLGIAFIGDFRQKLPTPEALQAAHDLLNYGVENKHLAEDYQLVGHRQLTATISPGDALQAHIQSWPNWSNIQN